MPELHRLVFDSTKGWKLVKKMSGTPGFLLLNTSLGYCATFDRDFNFCRVYGAAPADDLIASFSVLWKLSQGKGVMFHGCGVSDESKGYLFLGHSGDGKSTFARLWGASRVIHEDRAIAIKKGKEFWMQDGMPPKAQAPIEKVFFLSHGRRNRVIRRDGAEAVSRMLTRCFAPRWDKRGMEFTVDFCIRLAKKVPCYDFWFRPDRSAVEYIRIMD